jgi:hypothetical protein
MDSLRNQNQVQLWQPAFPVIICPRNTKFTSAWIDHVPPGILSEGLPRHLGAAQLGTPDDQPTESGALIGGVTFSA